MTRTDRTDRMFAVLAAAWLGFVCCLIAFGGSHTKTVDVTKPAPAGLTIYVQNFDPSFVSDATVKDDIPVWEQAANGAFRRTWHTPKLQLVFVARGHSAPRGAEVLQITANGPVDGAAAYHTQNDGRAAIVVYAGIDDAYGVSLSVAATHEIFERLADGTTSTINQGWPVDNFTVSHGQFQSPDFIPVPRGQLVLNEVCDPVEAFHYVLRAADGRQVWISDWVTQNYFNDENETPAGVGHFDFLGLTQAPLEVLPGGYQSLYVIDFPVYQPDGSTVIYTGWLSLTNFQRAADKAWLAGDRGKVVPFGRLHR